MISKRHFLGILVMAGFAIVLFLGVGCLPGETPEEAYAGYSEAADGGAIERGWIPEWLPETAVNIHEKHDLDRNTSILVFDVGGSFVIPEGCKPAATTSKASLSAGWWPVAEVAELPVHDCGSGLLAVDEAGMRIYYWRP